MTEQVLDMIKSRKNYYRDNFRRMVTLLFYCMFIILILFAAITYVYFTRGQHTFYATSADGKLTKLEPVARGTGLEEIGEQQKIIY